jgi:hypothetical protein
MQYYFHIRDGVTLLDDEGHDCADLASRTQALATSGAMLKELSGSAEFWSGEAWIMWVTDEPNGKGKNNPCAGVQVGTGHRRSQLGLTYQVCLPRVETLKRSKRA